MQSLDLAIVGAGAAGVFCAINTAALSGSSSIAIFEATQNPLTKVRVSGGGRCNVTHHCFEPKDLVKNYPRGFRELLGAFTKFQPADTVAWFESRGVKLKVEEDGRMFPVTDSSATIIQCFEHELEQQGVSVKKGCRIVSIARKDGGGFILKDKNGASWEAKQIFLATGSAPEGHELARSCGHTITDLAPSLFTFKIKDPRLEGFSGISFPWCHLKLEIPGAKTAHSFSGPLLITHWGLSGPAVLKLSAFAAYDLHQSGYQGRLMVNLIDETFEAADQKLVSFAQQFPKKQVGKNHPFTVVAQRWWEGLCVYKGIPETCKYAELSAAKRQDLTRDLVQGAYSVAGKGVFKEEFVTAGGVDLKEVDFRTMESKVAPGLFFGGELLNVDGITGGFNFQNAWTTATLAARALGERLAQP